MRLGELDHVVDGVDGEVLRRVGIGPVAENPLLKVGVVGFGKERIQALVSGNQLLDDAKASL